MAPVETDIEAVEVLLRRIEVVDYLRNGPKEKPELVERLDSSRSTIDRAIRDLDVVGLVEYTDSGYTATTLGELATDQLLELVETMRVGSELTPFLRWVPAEQFDLDLRYLATADLYVPEPNDPYAMVNRHVGVLENSNRHRVLLPLTGLHAMEALHEAIVEKEAKSTAVVVPGVADTFRSNPDYRPLFEEVVATGRFDMYVYEGTVPYFVGIFEELVQIGVDDEGEPRALVETDAAEVRAWAEELFEEYKRQSKRIT